MRRIVVLAVAVVLGAAAVIPLAAGAAKKRPKRTSFAFTDHIVGAQISATEAVYKTHDTRAGNGAGVQTYKLTGLKGTDKETTYYRGAVTKAHGSFTLGTPNADGISKLKGKGGDTNGTGSLRAFHSRYTYVGTFNLRTQRFKLTVEGTGSILK